MTVNIGIDGSRVMSEMHKPWREPPPKAALPTDDLRKPSLPVPHGPDQVLSKASREEKERNIQEALARLNEEMRKNDRSLHFSRDKEVNRMVITVKNPTSGEVIRQIPDEAVLRVAHNIEAIKGLLVNQLT